MSPMDHETGIRRSERLMAKESAGKNANAPKRRNKSLPRKKKAKLPLPTLDSTDLEKLSQELYERGILCPSPPKKRGRKSATSSAVPTSNSRSKKSIAAKLVLMTPSIGIKSSQSSTKSPPPAPQRNRRITDFEKSVICSSFIFDARAHEDQTPKRKSSCKVKLSEAPKSTLNLNKIEIGCQTEDEYNIIVANLQDQVNQLEVINRHQAVELENLQKIVSNTRYL